MWVSLILLVNHNLQFQLHGLDVMSAQVVKSGGQGGDKEVKEASKVVVRWQHGGEGWLLGLDLIDSHIAAMHKKLMKNLTSEELVPTVWDKCKVVSPIFLIFYCIKLLQDLYAKRDVVIAIGSDRLNMLGIKKFAKRINDLVLINSSEKLFDGDSGFYANSLANDGYPPVFLRTEVWKIHARTPNNFKLSDANGINVSLHSRLPDLNFPLSSKVSNSVVVGKWYCPFVFIKDGKLNDQVKKSIFYQITLEQKWNQIFIKETEHNEGNVESVESDIDSEAVFIEIRKESMRLSLEIIERMKWEEEKAGWSGVREKYRRSKVNIYEGIGTWKKFGCYVLVERFVLKRMDGSLVLTYEFSRTHQVKSIFE
ncbi:hypothetical protein Tco_1064254 [Tanacetum coccineum]